MFTPAIRAMVLPCYRRCTKSLSTLTLLMPRIRANHAHDAIAPDDLAIAANLFYRSHYFHRNSFRFRHIVLLGVLLGAEDDSRAGQVVGREVHCHLVARQNLYVVHPHLPGDVAQYDVAVLQLYPERRVRQRLQDFSLHLYRFFLRHQRVGNPPLKLAFLSRLSYCCDIMYACTCVMKSIVTTTMISSEVPPK